jgi:hypothetical protein
VFSLVALLYLTVSMDRRLNGYDEGFILLGAARAFSG